jgi:CRISPR system Cascade subunit CasB
MTAAVEPEKEAQTKRRHRRRGDFGAHVAGTITPLQEQYRKKSSAAVAVMAQLRAAGSLPPGGHYVVHQQLRVPDRLLEDYAGDAATDRECAKHTAMTMYAFHQQSIRDKPMHVDGPGLGTAVSLLAHASSSADAVRRRFAALGTATSYDATVHHLRSLVQLLKQHKIGLDYGLLAEDLALLRKPGRRVDVQAAWGRDYFRVDPDSADGDEATTSEESA